MSAAPKIAIIGGGPAGLTLARLLHRQGIPSTVFETDPSPESRHTAGGCLDLHETSGQLALKEAGLWDEFQKYARYDGEALVLVDRWGTKQIDLKDPDTGRPEIDRPDLRKMLLDSIPSEYIRWGHHLKRVDEDGTLHFADKTERGFDLVVGADGAWSKVRRVLSHIPPFYSGVTGIEWWLQDLDTKDPDLSAMLGNGSHFVFGDEAGGCLGAQRQSDRSVRAYAFMQKPETWVEDCGLDFNDTDALKSFLLQEYAEYAPELKQIIEAACGTMIPRPLYMLPVGLRWPRRARFTLLGDAAHLMTPFAGEGVNAAMHDALDLARAIVAHRDDDLAAAVAEYEDGMWPRAEATQKVTWVSLLERFDRGGTQKMKQRFEYLMEARRKGERVTDGGIGADF